MAQYKGMPSVQCAAKVQHADRQCHNRAIRGSTVCRKHGAALSVVKNAALVRTTIYDAIMLGDRRHPWTILADALHIADSLTRDVLVKVRT